MRGNKLIFGRFENPERVMVKIAYLIQAEGHFASQIWQPEDSGEEYIVSGINFDWIGETHESLSLQVLEDKTIQLISDEENNIQEFISLFNNLLGQINQ